MHTLNQLKPRYRANLENLAQLRGERVEDTAEKIALNLFRSVPKSVRGYDVDYSLLHVDSTGVEDGFPWLRTTQGRIFYDHPAGWKDVVMWVLLRDRIPAAVTAETFVVAVHAIKRYLKGAHGLQENARVVVDAGAYIGYKAIAYADAIGSEGQVIAVEMMPDNYALLEKNVVENGLEGQVMPVRCAVSNRSGVVEARRKHRQQATVATVDGLKLPNTETVEMDTLANVLDRSGVQRVDLLNVQVNGAELEALEGLDQWVARVGRFRVYCMYSQEGKQTEPLVRDWLEAQGARVITADRGVVTADRA